MGIHLIVYRRQNGKFVGEARLADWDCGRHVGDKEFAMEVLCDRDKTEAEREPGFDGEWYFRPKDVAAWKAWDAAYECNNGRWAGLADLLVKDTELWVYQSL